MRYRQEHKLSCAVFALALMTSGFALDQYSGAFSRVLPQLLQEASTMELNEDAGAIGKAQMAFLAGSPLPQAAVALIR